METKNPSFKVPSSARFLSCIKETLSTTVPENSIQFVCGTILLFEKSFGSKNKAAMQKILKEALENYGPDSSFSNHEEMLPIYSMLSKYFKLSMVSEIFERLHRKGSYRRCARFYVDWCKACRDDAKRLEILDLAFQENAEPASTLQLAKEELLANMVTPSSSDNSSPGHSSLPVSEHFGRRPHAEKSVKRALFAGKSINTLEKNKSVPEKECTSSSYDFVLPESGTSSYRTSAVCDSPPPSNFEVPVHRTSSSSDSLPTPDPNAENINPSGVTEPIVRRKLAGILVASLDFTLEDYDFSDDINASLKSSEALKKEDNEANIRNNMPSEDTEQPSSSFPCLPPHSLEKRLTPSPTNSDKW